MAPSALNGVKVLDLTHYIAGPYCTKLLADFGAQVIKIERPGGDPARDMPPFYHDERHPEKSLPFLYLNTAKRSVSLNLKSAQGIHILRELAKDADILVENFSPRVMPSLGLDFPTLREFLNRLALPGAKVVTDQHAGYNGLTGRTYVSVNHSLGQYVDDHGNTTNGIESLWAQLKRWLRGTYHQVSVKHLPRYLRELMWRHNHRNSPVLDQMGAVVRNMDGRRLRLRDMRSGGRFVTAMTVELGKFLPLQRELFQLAA